MLVNTKKSSFQFDSNAWQMIKSSDEGIHVFFKSMFITVRPIEDRHGEYTAEGVQQLEEFLQWLHREEDPTESLNYHELIILGPFFN